MLEADQAGISAQLGVGILDGFEGGAGGEGVVGDVGGAGGAGSEPWA